MSHKLCSRLAALALFLAASVGLAQNVPKDATEDGRVILEIDGSRYIASGFLRLAPESVTPPPPPPASDCAARPECFSFAGIFHAPTEDNPVRRLDVTPPVGTYREIRVRLTFENGGWNQALPSARHNVFWMARDGNGDLIGYVNLLGPGKNILRLGHGIGVKHDEKARIEKRVICNPGERYLLEYTYDLARQSVVLTLADQSGKQLARLESVPNVQSGFAVSKKSHIWLDFGFDGKIPSEPKTLGWKYQDLVVEFVPE